MEFLVTVNRLLGIYCLSLIFTLLSVRINFQIVPKSYLGHRCIFFISVQRWWSIVYTGLFIKRHSFLDFIWRTHFFLLLTICILNYMENILHLTETLQQKPNFLLPEPLHFQLQGRKLLVLLTLCLRRDHTLPLQIPKSFATGSFMTFA